MIAKPHVTEINDSSCQVRPGSLGNEPGVQQRWRAGKKALGTALMSSVLFVAQAPQASLALAQEEAAPVPMPAPIMSTEPAVAPVEPALAAAPAPEPVSEAPKAPVLKIGVGLRTGLNLIFNGAPSDKVSLTLDDGLVDQANLRPYMTGDLTENVSFFSSFEIGTAKGLGNFAILDAIAQVKIRPEFQIWLGQHIGANDRNNMNGPFFGNGWNFAITVPSYPFDVGARDRGVTFWGLIGGGRLKYHASVLDLQKTQAIENARYAGRVTLHLLEPEDFYYNSGTYFGKKNVLAIGAVVNYQKGIEDAMMPMLENDFFGYSFDVFYEQNLGTSGTLTLEGGFWDFSGVEAGYAVNQGTVDLGLGVVGPKDGKAYMVMASWLMPEKTGIGYIQPNARWQAFNPDASGASTTNTIDVGVGYIIDGFNHRWYVNYRHQDADVSADSLQVGAQFMM